jgi:hypothetical protein
VVVVPRLAQLVSEIAVLEPASKILPEALIQVVAVCGSRSESVHFVLGFEILLVQERVEKRLSIEALDLLIQIEGSMTPPVPEVGSH